MAVDVVCHEGHRFVVSDHSRFDSDGDPICPDCHRDDYEFSGILRSQPIRPISSPTSSVVEKITLPSVGQYDRSMLRRAKVGDRYEGWLLCVLMAQFTPVAIIEDKEGRLHWTNVEDVCLMK